MLSYVETNKKIMMINKRHSSSLGRKHFGLISVTKVKNIDVGILI